ncbi:MAG: DNA-directed DNA polymerase I [Sulfolobales archaeon]
MDLEKRGRMSKSGGDLLKYIRKSNTSNTDTEVRDRQVVGGEGVIQSITEDQSILSSNSNSSDSSKNMAANVNIITIDRVNTDPPLQLEEVSYAEDAYVLEVSYDGASGRAVVYLYDENSGKLKIYRDRSGHKPYFYVDLDPTRVREILKEDVRGVVDIYRVSKMNLLKGKIESKTKIVVSDPLIVRKIRDKFQNYWEANIKYHHNYIYDEGIIPGLRHKILNGKIEPVYSVDLKKIEEEVNKVFSEEPEEIRREAISWYILFEEKPPKIRRAAIDIEVFTPVRTRVPNPKTAEYPIVSIAISDSDGRNIVFVLMREGIGSLDEIRDLGENAEIRVYKNEKDLILDFFSIASTYPVIITFNGEAFDLPYLYERALRLGIDRNVIPIVFKETHATFRTALHVDLYKFFRNKSIQNYALEGKYKEFTLDAVATAILGVGKISHEEGVGRMSIGKLVRYNLRDAQLTLQLTLYQDELIWKLIILLMRISKLGLEDVTRTQVSTWIKNLFYWEHRRKNYFIPSEREIRESKSKKTTEAVIKGKKYAGAIVIEPPQGVFFKVAVLDFASLYPSIIKRWNLSYETIDPEPGRCRNVRDIFDERDLKIHEVCMDRPGITAFIIGLLRDFRVRIFKKKSKSKDLDPSTKSWYDVVQRALKVYVNAAYGVFGHENFPLFAVPVAESVTALGRMIITRTMEKARELGLLVLYGDTDSLFLWDPEPEKLNQLREWVLKSFGLDLEIDKEFRFVAFSLKKNYFGVTTQGSIEIKGLVGKKKNTPKFAREAFGEILKKISSVEKPEEIIKVREWIKDMVHDIYMKLKHYEYTLEDMSFTMMLSKDVREYTKTTPQHVKAALMLLREGIKISAGDNIIFVKVRGREGVKPIQLAKISEIDLDKYIEILRTTLEQIMLPLSIDWDEISGSILKLHRFIES